MPEIPSILNRQSINLWFQKITAALPQANNQMKLQKLSRVLNFAYGLERLVHWKYSANNRNDDDSRLKLKIKNGKVFC